MVSHPLKTNIKLQKYQWGSGGLQKTCSGKLGSRYNAECFSQNPMQVLNHSELHFSLLKNYDSYC